MQETIGGIADQVALAVAEGRPSDALKLRIELEQFFPRLTAKDVQRALVKAYFRLIMRRMQTCDRAQLERLINALRLNMRRNRADIKVARINARQQVRAYHDGKESQAQKLHAIAVELLDSDALSSTFQNEGVEHAKMVGKNHAAKHSTLWLVGTS